MADIDTTLGSGMDDSLPILHRKDADTIDVKDLESQEAVLLNEINSNLRNFLDLLSSQEEEEMDANDTDVGVQWLKSKDQKVGNRRDALLKAGAAGTAAVYLGEKIDEQTKEFGDEKKGPFAKIGEWFKNLGPMLSSLGGSKLLRMGGLAAFAALKWDDIAEGFQMIKDGNLWKGIETILIGNPDNITLDNASEGVLKQGGAWAGMGMAIGGPLGAAVGFVLGSLAKTIQTGIKTARDAYEQEWDKDVNKIVDDMRERSANADTQVEKWRANSANMWSLFGTYMAGAKRTAEEYRDQGRSAVVGFLEGFGNIYNQIRTANMTPEEAEAYMEKANIRKENRDKFLTGLKETTTKIRDFIFGNEKRLEREAEKNAKRHRQNMVDKLAEQFKILDEAVASGSISAQDAEIQKKMLADHAEQQLSMMGNFQPLAEDNIFGKMRELFKNIGSWISGKFNELIAWFRSKIIWPIRDFFDNIGQFFEFYQSLGPEDFADMLRGKLDFGGKFKKYKEKDAFTAILNDPDLKPLVASVQRSAAIEGRELQASDLVDLVYNDVYKKIMAGEYVDKDILELLGKTREEIALGGMRGTSVNDVIITKSGQILKTNPKDTIFATKAFDDGTMNQVLNSANRTNQTDNAMLNALMQIRDKVGNGGGGAVVQNNTMSRFNPATIMQTGMVEVF